MCGRFSITAKKDMIQKRFHAEFDSAFTPRYNAVPSQNLPVILNTDMHHIGMVHWGVMPPWIIALGKKSGLINIRMETLRDKHTFERDLLERRCLVIADGFYEWKKEGAKKVPYRLTIKDEKPFAFAGLWEENKDKSGKPIRTFAIITTQPNSVMKDIHSRMPVILEKEMEKEWLSPELKKKDAIDLLEPYAGFMSAQKISTLINKPSNDDSRVLVEVK
jgi:putative SOS response-associated peptidase YedK